MSDAMQSLPALSETRLSEIEARLTELDAAGVWHSSWHFDPTREPWPGVFHTDPVGGYTFPLARLYLDEPAAEPVGRFIAWAPEDIPDLLAEVRRLQGENARIAEERETYRRAWNRSDELLASAREETAQAVREERRCCAQIADDEASKSDDIDAGYLSAQRIARKIRSRSLPGETADA